MNKVPTRKCLVCRKRFEVKSNSHWICGFECATVQNNEKVDKKKEQLKKTEWTKEKAVLKIITHAKENKKHLQDEINKLSRMIDAYFEYPCIDCGKPFTTQQIDACHLISRKKNSSLKWNLHNLHRGHNACNFHNPSHETNYKNGLVSRYGKDYLEMVEDLPIKYKEIHLNNVEIAEKLKIVRKLNRTFHTYQFENSIQARDMFNKIIGIYDAPK